MTRKAYLYGEIHGSEIVNLKEFEIWKDFYNRGFYHLFMEIPYFEAQFLNIWMESKDDSILNELWSDNEGTSGNSPFDHDFFAKIKLLCPKTIFHGTDIGHAYGTTGKRFLKTVSSDSEEYHFAAENIEQGKNFYEIWKSSPEEEADSFRENAMAENFIREFNSIDCDIVGFYGEAHVFSECVGNFGISENMRSLLLKHCGKEIEIVPELIKNFINPLSVEEIEIKGKRYLAGYFGKVYTPFDETCEFIEIFRLNDCGNEFINCPQKENYIPEALYPVPLNDGDVFVIDSLKGGKSFLRQIFICCGFSEEYGKITVEIDSEAL